MEFKNHAIPRYGKLVSIDFPMSGNIFSQFMESRWGYPYLSHSWILRDFSFDSNIMYLCWDHSSSISFGKENRQRKQQKMTKKGDMQSKKWCLFTQILLCTFFCNSIFIPSWFLIKLWQYYSKQQKEHIQEKVYQCIWNN